MIADLVFHPSSRADCSRGICESGCPVPSSLPGDLCEDPPHPAPSATALSREGRGPPPPDETQSRQISAALPSPARERGQWSAATAARSAGPMPIEGAFFSRRPPRGREVRIKERTLYPLTRPPLASTLSPVVSLYGERQAFALEREVGRHSSPSVRSMARTSPHIAGPADFAAAFAVPRETVEKLELYAELLRKWQRAINLVAPSTLEDVWHRHFTDCAQLINHAPNAESWVDLGSGAGFPGLVIAIILANHENHIVHLIEFEWP